MPWKILLYARSLVSKQSDVVGYGQVRTSFNAYSMEVEAIELETRLVMCLVVNIFSSMQLLSLYFPYNLSIHFVETQLLGTVKNVSADNGEENNGED